MKKLMIILACAFCVHGLSLRNDTVWTKYFRGDSLGRFTTKVYTPLCSTNTITAPDSLKIKPINGIVNICPADGHAILNITNGSGYMKNAYLNLNGTRSYINWTDHLYFTPANAPDCMHMNSGGDTTVYVNYKLRVPWICDLGSGNPVIMDSVRADSIHTSRGYNTTGSYYKNGAIWKPDSCVLSDSCTGGAVRAAKLTTARSIGLVNFDGTANIIPDTCKRSGTCAVAAAWTHGVTVNSVPYANAATTMATSPIKIGSTTTAVQIFKGNGTTNVLTVDTSNARVGIGGVPAGYPLYVYQATGDMYTKFSSGGNAIYSYFDATANYQQLIGSLSGAAKWWIGRNGNTRLSINNLDDAIYFQPSNTQTAVLASTGLLIAPGVISPRGLIHTASVGASGAFLLETYSATTTHAPINRFIKSHSGVLNAATQTIDGDVLGTMQFMGINSSSTAALGVEIDAIQNGVAGASYIPTDLKIYTSSATYVNTDQLNLSNTGKVGIKTAIASITNNLTITGGAKADTLIAGTVSISAKDSTATLIVTTKGYVNHIGNLTSGHVVTIDTNLSVTGNLDITKIMYVYNTAGDFFRTNLNADNTLRWAFSNSAAGVFSISDRGDNWVSGGDSLTIDRSGNGVLTGNFTADTIKGLTAKFTDLSRWYYPLHRADDTGLIDGHVWDSAGHMIVKLPQEGNYTMTYNGDTIMNYYCGDGFGINYGTETGSSVYTTFWGDVRVGSNGTAGGNLAVDGSIDAGGDLSVGGGLQIKVGANSRMDTITLVSGTATISNTSVTAVTNVIPSYFTVSGTPGTLYKSAVVASTSYTITSTAGITDNSKIYCLLIEPAP